MARLARVPEVEALIEAYRADLIRAGHFAENEVTSPARAFLLRIGGPAGWSQLSLEQQSAVVGARESALVTCVVQLFAGRGGLPAPPEHGTSASVEVALLKSERLADPETRAPQQHDQRSEAVTVAAITDGPHDRDDLLDGRWIGGVVLALVSRRATLVAAGHRRG